MFHKLNETWIDNYTHNMIEKRWKQLYLADFYFLIAFQHHKHKLLEVSFTDYFFTGIYAE